MKQNDRSPLFLWTIWLLLALAVAQIILPSRTQSTLENRPLKQYTALTLPSIASGQWMRDTEDFVADQIPLRDTWMMAQAVWDAALMRNERNGILAGKEGWLFEPSANLDLRTARANIEALNALGKRADIPVSLMIVPMSSGIYPEYLPAGYKPDDQWDIIQDLYATAPALRTLDIMRRMEAYAFLSTMMDAPTLYYRTDHHWTYDGAQLAYELWREEKGLTQARSRPAIKSAAGFTGTYFSRAPSPFVPPESLVYHNPSGLVLTVDGEIHFAANDAQRMDDPDVRDKYAGLLYGNNGYSMLENNNADGGTLLVIKDSYANALLTMLSQHYRTIEIVDPRYFAGDFGKLLEETEAEDILCVYGLTTLLTDRNLLLLSDSWGG